MSWAEFDVLPPPLREWMRRSPVDLGTYRATQRLSVGMSVNQVLAGEVAVAKKALRRIVLAHYGPTHPQAQA